MDLAAFDTKHSDEIVHFLIINSLIWLVYKIDNIRRTTVSTVYFPDSKGKGDTRMTVH